MLSFVRAKGSKNNAAAFPTGVPSISPCHSGVPAIEEIEPALDNIADLPQALGEAEHLLADTGYFSQDNVQRCQEANLVPLIPEKRDKHNLPLQERFRQDPEPPPNPDPVQAMRHRLQTQEGKALYAKRKSSVETVFGIIKHVQGFRQF